MTPSRSTILTQLANGQITADQAAQQLNQTTGAPMTPATPHTAPTPPATSTGPSRWLHVRVTELSTGRAKVNVNIPINWVEVGLKIGARYAEDMRGIDFAPIMADIRNGMTGKLVEVEEIDDDERVEIYVD